MTFLVPLTKQEKEPSALAYAKHGFLYFRKLNITFDIQVTISNIILCIA